jgi:hypothetical protein
LTEGGSGGLNREDAKAAKMVRFSFWLHFACGAVLGLLVGLNVWGEPSFGLYDSAAAGWVCMVGGAIVFGLALGIAKIRFDWDNFSKRGKNW